ncbi:UDP-N-acetylglucosamine-N-acetylmuramylpentapeptide N-acetylglucosamine transferase [Scopulibacillus darangshiensis]|uniref:UDP-N-acetylglucosamine--N-acetylmuramyl-(pentapeptide) pyrophosphoryl-undecaprenol N-acetylglucosamine transferase n=1 Tax=Scopulibacillus darangshiensis TaxID=442528 RepID=A0A4R2P916_9BACL|nr:undecaprenyldiphospho-muramoylpentapeptide beta-N-acetylglucosaminyltransferase [Scopulibacillus darangshiensis]TCP31520.1 UDP-N-acetylglucosamine-N-acetylmuramylpentapeptide N-acetylglucosamine transferase [Scopulibacillus darangshiensis]
MEKKIVLTGGGSAGHVTPNLALIPKLKDQGWHISYIGSHQGIERELIDDTGIPYYPISSGKLRRYFDAKNFKDPFKVLKGLMQAYILLKKLKPDVIFSKGGFVSVPVVIAGWLNKIPVFIHESDITPGLANKISVKFASKIFVTFDEAAKYLPKEKVLHSGSPIREDILTGNRKKGLEFLGFNEAKPVITVMGGSLGAKKINNVVRGSLKSLLENYQIVHLCGKGNLDAECDHVPGYRQFEYAGEELPDILAATNMLISRAGSNAIFEFLALQKPMILIPLSASASRGDQILNAKSFEKKGYCKVITEEDLDGGVLERTVTDVYKNRFDFIDNMKKSGASNTLQNIIDTLTKGKKK